jgi:methionine aminopeptidase
MSIQSERELTHLRTIGRIVPRALDAMAAAVRQPDGWTMVTADRSLSAHYGHTIAIARGAPILLTAA